MRHNPEFVKVKNFANLYPAPAYTCKFLDTLQCLVNYLKRLSILYQEATNNKIKNNKTIKNFDGGGGVWCQFFGDFQRVFCQKSF